MKNSRLTPMIVLGIVVCIGLLMHPASAQKTKGKTRPATTKQLMKGLVGANCGALAKALKAEKTNWDEIALRAALLNEASYTLMADGRCPDGKWANAAKAVRTSSATVLKEVKAKNLDGAKTAFKALTSGGCAGCHKAHKKK